MSNNIVEKLFVHNNDTDTKHKLNLENKPVRREVLNQIEAGIDIETLETLDLPICLYCTQITIHGLFPEQSGNGYVNGYKNIFQNKNKSIGIRYSAIDAAKKKALKHICYYARQEKRTKFFCSESSTSYKFIQYANVNNRDEAITAANTFKVLLQSIPNNLFYGTRAVNYVQDVYGRKYVECIIDFGAIKKENLEQFALLLFGMGEAEANNLQVEAEAKREREAIERKAESEGQANKAKMTFEEYKSKNADKIISLPKSGLFYMVYIGIGNELKRRLVKSYTLKNGKVLYHRVKREGKTVIEANVRSHKSLVMESTLKASIFIKA